MVAFFMDAAEQGIAYEGLVLACMLESDAATFAPQVGRVPGDTFPDSHVLYYVYCLADLDDFLHRAHREAADKKVKLSDLRVSVSWLCGRRPPLVSRNISYLSYLVDWGTWCLAST